MRYSVSDCVRYVSELLRDQEPNAEFTVWSEPLLVNALRDGLSIIASVDAKSMLARQEITLQPGGLQQLPDALEHVIVLAQIEPVFSTNFVEKDISAFKLDSGDIRSANTPTIANACSTTVTTEWKLERWGWGQVFPDKLFVYPPVPNDGKTRKLIISHLPVISDISDTFILSQSYYAALISWMLYRALGANLESAAHTELAKTHLMVVQSLLRMPASAQG